MAHRFWPLFDIRVRTARLELRALTGQEYVDRYAKRKADVGEDMVEPAHIPTTPTTPTTPQLATAG